MPGVNKENQITDSENELNNIQETREVELSQTDRINKHLLKLFLRRINNEGSITNNFNSSTSADNSESSSENDWE